MPCPAFRDGEHRLAFDHSSALDDVEQWVCACNARALNAGDAPELLTINENSDFASLPFMLGYSTEDYPAYIEQAAEAQTKESVTGYVRTIPPHFCEWVDDANQDTMLDTTRQHCTVAGCSAKRELTHSQMADEREAEEGSLVGETQAEWTKRMGGH